MAVKTKKAQPEETPSEQFERVMQKVTRRQQRREQRRALQLKEASATSTR